MRTLLSADQANQAPPDTLGEYTERVLNYNVDARRKQLKRTQKSLMQPMGVTSEGAVSQRLKGITHWSLISAVNVAQSLDTSIEKLLDDSAMKMEIERQAVALRVQLDQINQMTGNKKATGDTPVASGELLRLGLNQRPSDIRFGLAVVGLLATGIDNTPALLFLQIGVSSRMFTLQLVFRRASARNAQ